MAKSYSLPPRCILRPACATDRVALRMLMLGFDRWATPASSYSRLIPQDVVIILAIATTTIFIILFISEIIGFGAGLTGAEIFFLRVIFCLSVILPFLPIYIIGVFQPSYSECWVVECKGLLVAYAILSHSSKLTELRCLFVAPNYRKKGRGSYIIKSLMQKINKPIYLIPALGKVGFYTRLGFVPVKRLFPTIIRRNLKDSRIGCPLLVYDPSQEEK
jgi:GNAT superfamily N-acetyltransferase